MKAKPTGNYKLYKQQTGKSGKTEVAKGTEKDVDDYYLAHRETEEKDGYVLYKQEEVIYKNTHKDSTGNEFDSSPTWRNVPIK